MYIQSGFYLGFFVWGGGSYKPTSTTKVQSQEYTGGGKLEVLGGKLKNLGGKLPPHWIEP